MLDKNQIIEYLNSLREHKMAEDIFVPTLNNMGLNGVKFTGGPDEQGIDIEYYELTQPEKEKSYVGIQFKKGNLVYRSGGSKNSVKEVKNQAEEAFDKEMHDIDEHSVRYISRFIVATTGDINENARKFIGRARQKGNDRRIDYWSGDRLAEYVQNYWMSEFIDYFQINETEESSESDLIVNVEYIEENYRSLVQKCQKMRATINSREWSIVIELLDLAIKNNGGSSPLSDLLMELGNTEEFYREEFQHLHDLGYLYSDESDFSLDGHAYSLWELYESISEEIDDADEDQELAEEILSELIE